MLTKRQLITLVAGPCFFVTIAMFVRGTSRAQPMSTAGTLLWMAMWWLSEAVPVAVTAMLPAVVFPMLGVIPAKQVFVKRLRQ